MNRQTKRLLAAGVVIAVGWAAQQAGVDLRALGVTGSSTSTSSSSAPSAPFTSRSGSALGSPSSARAAADRIEQAAARRESGFMVTLDARVAKNLRDDMEGSRHQRFLIELETGRTLLVAHNIDLADRIPLRENERVQLRGQYEWNEKGGVIHWTHRDPKGDHPGGWIEFEGVRVE